MSLGKGLTNKAVHCTLTPVILPPDRLEAYNGLREKTKGLSSRSDRSRKSFNRLFSQKFPGLVFTVHHIMPREFGEIFFWLGIDIHQPRYVCCMLSKPSAKRMNKIISQCDQATSISISNRYLLASGHLGFDPLTNHHLCFHDDKYGIDTNRFWRNFFLDHPLVNNKFRVELAHFRYLRPSTLYTIRIDVLSAVNVLKDRYRTVLSAGNDIYFNFDAMSLRNFKSIS